MSIYPLTFRRLGDSKHEVKSPAIPGEVVTISGPWPIGLRYVATVRDDDGDRLVGNDLVELATASVTTLSLRRATFDALISIDA